MKRGATWMTLLAVWSLGWAGRADVKWNGLYHNNPKLDARTELVPPGAAGGGGAHFLDLDAAHGTVTVSFLTDHPACHGPVACRVRFYADKVELRDASWITNVVLNAAAPFHGVPASGTYTVEIWRATWQVPAGFTGTVYYAPQVLEQGEKVNLRSLVREVGANSGPEWGVNDFFWKDNPQAVGSENVAGVDYSFQWPPTASAPSTAPVNLDWMFKKN